MFKSIRTASSVFAVFVVMLVLVLGLGGEQATAQGMKAAPQHGSNGVADIVRDPAEVPPPVGNREATTVKVELVAKEVVGQLDAAARSSYRYWTFNGKVPGPMIRVRQGDMVQVTVRNDASSHMVHSVDFHAALGPGGGAALSQVTPGQEKTFTFEATTPGLYVYHCGTPMIGDHIANGMYGLILVEPAGGLPQVDHEYYVMQGEIYTAAPKGKAGLQIFSEAKLLQESPEYFVFNGAVDALTKEHPLHANTGETVRIYLGNAGPNATSSFHVVGEIFTRDFQLGSLTSPAINGVQTASIPAGGAAILELKTTTAGQFAFMDHAMARMPKGLMGVLKVDGEQNAQLMHAGPASRLANAPAGKKPTAEIIGKGDMDPAPLTGGLAGSAHDNSMGMMRNMDHMQMNEAPGQSTDSNVRQIRSQVRPVRPGQMELDGCLTLGSANPRLTLFHSQKSYQLEPRPMLLTDSPLAFSENNNALVHVTGHVDHASMRRRENLLVVESVDQLAPTCDSKASLAELRSAAQARLVQASAVPAEAVSIGMGDMSFQQPEIVINVGQEVVWKNTSSAIHNVVTDPALALVAADVHLPGGAKTFNSGYMQPGQTFAYRFTVPGVYRYVCTLHETGGMKGVVIVKLGNTTNVAEAGVPGRDLRVPQEH
jgi:copper-containing nitrite reductase